jgi:hypothetical protein
MTKTVGKIVIQQLESEPRNPLSPHPTVLEGLTGIHDDGDLEDEDESFGFGVDHTEAHEVVRETREGSMVSDDPPMELSKLRDELECDITPTL